MAAIDDFKARIRSIMSIGTSLDSDLDGFIRDALRDFEESIDLPYQRILLTKTITLNDRLLTTTRELKRVLWARRVETINGSTHYYHVPLVQEWQAEETGPGVPIYCWFDSEDTLEFDLADGPHNVQVKAVAFSQWPLAEDSPLWSRYQRYLLYRTIIEVATAARKPDLLATFQALYDSNMQKLQVTADALQGDFAEIQMGGSQ